MRFSLLVVLLLVIMTFSLYNCDDYQSEPELVSDESSEETESPDESLPEISDESKANEIKGNEIKANEIKANVSPTERNAMKEDSGSDTEQKPIEDNMKQNARQFDDEGGVESLCDNPVIHSADRLFNNTIRVYRNNHYWDLIGLPSQEAYADGPHRIWWTNMAPITKNTCTHTVLAGLFIRIHLKYVRNKFWHWNDIGVQTMGGTDGWVWNEFPEHGFSACYHDGQASGLGPPLLVAFHALKVYYYNTDTWVAFGSRDGYYSGNYGERFPPDVTAAFSFPSNNPNIKYYVYLFKEDKYCFRPWKSKTGQECDQWRENKELFGCYKNGQKPKPQPQPGPGPIDPMPGVKEPPVEAANQNSCTLLKPQIINPLIVAFIYLILSFHLHY